MIGKKVYTDDGDRQYDLGSGGPRHSSSSHANRVVRRNGSAFVITIAENRQGQGEIEVASIISFSLTVLQEQ